MATKTKPAQRQRTVAEAEAQDPMFYINRTGFGKYREDLLEAGFNPDDPRDRSMCEWMVHSWSSDN